MLIEWTQAVKTRTIVRRFSAAAFDLDSDSKFEGVMDVGTASNLPWKGRFEVSPSPPICLLARTSVYNSKHMFLNRNYCSMESIEPAVQQAQAIVEREGNLLTFPNLSQSFIVGSFLIALHQGRLEGCTNFRLNFATVDRVFPNVCVPVAGIIEYYRAELGISFEVEDEPEFLAHTQMKHPLVFGIDQGRRSSPLNTVWNFSTAEEIHRLVDAMLDEVSRAAVCEQGVIAGLEWCLNEVMDNVLQHSNTNHGYSMAQIHPQTQHIAICVYDNGQGIYNSLRNSHYSPATAVDAITIALEEGVTRDKKVGQGNGMWGLHNIVRANSGSLNITSGPGFLGMHGETPTTMLQIPYLSKERNCTTVDFQIDFDKGISIAKALGGHEPVNSRIECLEDDHDRIVYKLADKASGTGTRRSGVAIRNEVLNLSKPTESVIVLDITGVSVVSSSFADEFIGKLALQYGFIAFTQRFRLVGMNPIVQAIANRSVSQRLGLGE